MLEPSRADSSKKVSVQRLENLILSGKLTIGEKLPPERELALQLGVSRPVVHEGLVEMAAKGLVTMKPRVGTTVNDYRKEGSLAILSSLFNYHNGQLSPHLLNSLLEMRLLFEVEAARLAARRRTPDQLAELRDLLEAEEKNPPEDTQSLTDLDFTLHHLITLASGNLLYPLILNSFRQVYTNLAGQFYTQPSVAAVVLDYHRELAAAVEKRDEKSAAHIMKNMLDHGADCLKSMPL